MFINTILFIVDRNGYLNWCIRSASGNLDSILQQNQLEMNDTKESGFSTEMGDFYNCSRTWEDELKFSIMMTVVMIMVYVSWTFENDMMDKTADSLLQVLLGY